MNDIQHKAFSADIKVAAGERAVTAIVSTSAVDREGDVLMPDGCNSKQYEMSPTLFFNHDYYTLPVGKCVAIKREDSRIVAKFIMAERPAAHPEGEEWFPDTLLSLFQQGVVKGFSVGFQILESRAASTRDKNRFGEDCQRVVSKWALFEISVAPMPCQQEAVALAVSKGLVTRDTADKIFGKVEEVIPEPEAAEVLEKVAEEVKALDDALEPEPIVAAVEEAIDAEDGPVKRVVRTVEAPEEDEPITVKRVHRFIVGDKPKESKAVKLVMREIAKARGSIYAD